MMTPELLNKASDTGMGKHEIFSAILVISALFFCLYAIIDVIVQRQRRNDVSIITLLWTILLIVFLFFSGFLFVKIAWPIAFFLWWIFLIVGIFWVIKNFGMSIFGAAKMIFKIWGLIMLFSVALWFLDIFIPLDLTAINPFHPFFGLFNV